MERDSQTRTDGLTPSLSITPRPTRLRLMAATPSAGTRAIRRWRQKITFSRRTRSGEREQDCHHDRRLRRCLRHHSMSTSSSRRHQPANDWSIAAARERTSTHEAQRLSTPHFRFTRRPRLPRKGRAIQVGDDAEPASAGPKAGNSVVLSNGYRGTPLQSRANSRMDEIADRVAHERTRIERLLTKVEAEVVPPPRRWLRARRCAFHPDDFSLLSRVDDSS